MMKFTHNDWDQHNIINNIVILTKWGADTIYIVLPTKYHKYSSTTILKHVNILDQVDKLPYKCLLDVMP